MFIPHKYMDLSFIHKTSIKHFVWWCTLVISAPRRLSQEPGRPCLIGEPKIPVRDAVSNKQQQQTKVGGSLGAKPTQAYLCSPHTSTLTYTHLHTCTHMQGCTRPMHVDTHKEVDSRPEGLLSHPSRLNPCPLPRSVTGWNRKEGSVCRPLPLSIYAQRPSRKSMPSSRTSSCRLRYVPGSKWGQLAPGCRGQKVQGNFSGQ